MQLLPGSIRSPVTCGVRSNVDALEHGFLEVLGIVGEDEDVFRTNCGSYAGYVEKSPTSYVPCSRPPSKPHDQTQGLKDLPMISPNQRITFLLQGKV